MEVKIRFKLTKNFHPKFGTLHFGKYQIEPIPSSTSPFDTSSEQYILTFSDEMKNSEILSNPLQEGLYFLWLLSLSIGSKVEILSSMINSVNSKTNLQKNTDIDYHGTVEKLPDINGLLEKINTQSFTTIKQVLRAIDV